MIIMFIAVLGFSLSRTIDAANTVAQVRQIIVMVDDNALWDAAATAVYTNLSDTEFFWSSWGFSSAEGKYFDTVLVLDHEGRPLLGYRRGRATRFDPMARYGESFRILLERADRQRQAVGGLAGSSEGPVLIGIANIVPTNGALDHLVPKSGPYWLVFTKPFDQGAADLIGRSLLLDDMKLSDKPLAGRQRRAFRRWPRCNCRSRYGSKTDRKPELDARTARKHRNRACPALDCHCCLAAHFHWPVLWPASASFRLQAGRRGDGRQFEQSAQPARSPARARSATEEGRTAGPGADRPRRIQGHQ
jgi:hypothetical protein